MAKLGFYEKLAVEMLKRDEDRDDMFLEMDRMWMSQWELPFEQTGYIHKVVSTDPHDAIRSGTRVLSSGEPRIKLQPMGPMLTDRKNANRIERGLKWHYKNAIQRRSADAVADAVLSALLYDEVVAQVIYLPWQKKEAMALEQDISRLEAADSFGPFAVVFRNPKDVHVTYSDYMPEEVLMKSVMPVEEVVNFWGEKNTQKLIKDKKNLKDNKGLGWATVFDYTDYDVRVVWAHLHEKERVNQKLEGGGIQILNMKHKLPFMPWICRVGGTNLFTSGIAQRMPLLWSLFMSGQWNTQNVVETLVASEAIAYSGAPRIAVEGPTDQVEIGYGEIGRKAWIPPGNKIQELRPPVIDAGLLAIGDRVGNRIAKSTIPRVLQTGDIPAGTPFSALNLITQSGLKSIVPYKRLAEQALSGVYKRMLEWIDHSGDEVFTFTDTTLTEKDGGFDEVIGIEKGDFDVNNIHITVELAEDAPTDRLQRANIGRMLKTDMNYPTSKVMEHLGEEDPAALVDEARQEREEDMEEKIKLQSMEAEAMGEVQRAEMEKNFRLQTKLQLEAQQQAQQVQQAQQQQQQGGGNLAGNLRNRQVQQQAAQNRGVGGQGFNPGEGGSPPIEGGAPTREQATGQTRTGEETGG